MRFGKCRAGGLFQDVPGRLYTIKESGAGHGNFEGAPERLGLTRSREAQTDLDSGVPHPCQFIKNRPVVEDTAFERRRVNLIKAEVISQGRAALLSLTAQRGERVFLDLVFVGVNFPAG